MSDPYLDLLRALPADWRVRISFDVDIHSCRLFPDRHAYSHTVFSLFDESAELLTEWVRPVIHPHLSTPPTPQLIALAAHLVSLHIAEAGFQPRLPLDEPQPVPAPQARALLTDHGLVEEPAHLFDQSIDAHSVPSSQPVDKLGKARRTGTHRPQGAT